MEDKITWDQAKFIATLIEYHKNIFEPYLSNKIIDTSKIGTFIDWTYELTKKEASDVIEAMEDKNAALFEYVLTGYGYYRWIEITEPVDELAFTRGESTMPQYNKQPLSF